MEAFLSRPTRHVAFLFLPARDATSTTSSPSAEAASTPCLHSPEPRQKQGLPTASPVGQSFALHSLVSLVLTCEEPVGSLRIVIGQVCDLFFKVKKSLMVSLSICG